MSLGPPAPQTGPSCHTHPGHCPRLPLSWAPSPQGPQGLWVHLQAGHAHVGTRDPLRHTEAHTCALAPEPGHRGDPTLSLCSTGSWLQVPKEGLGRMGSLRTGGPKHMPLAVLASLSSSHWLQTPEQAGACEAGVP